ncbi:hypothetical protein M2302_002255 [Micromonospora sp. A200]|uniref:hypothetical protein n=1 Tax=Micromonospora sp. A200 TaxID=2940568 RepID=UPI002476C7F6|nr:hypothetical protein [Micromonospora sp. A200]MDH6462080.1 hypothetical protein [Micromonospora sp. A200]
MIKINGFEVHAVLPHLYAGGVDGYVIAALHPERGEAVTANVRTLGDTTWSNGNYFTAGTPQANLQRAVRNLPRRASLTTEQLLADVEEN